MYIHIPGIVLSILLIIFSLPTTLFAQSRVLHISTIQLQQHSKKPLSSVRIMNGSNGVVSDKLGHADMRIDISEQNITYSKPGYISGNIIIPNSHNDTSITLVLQLSEFKSKAVHITGDRNSVYGIGSQEINIINSEELDKHRGQTLGETLKRVTGLHTLQTGPSISKPILRGMHSQRLLISNAGIAQEGQQWGSEHSPEIDAFSIGTVEILKGAAGVEYGPGAMGGMIRIIPPDIPDTSHLLSSLTLQGQSNNWQGAISPSVSWGNKQDNGNTIGIRGQITCKKAGNAKTAEYVLGNTGFTELNGQIQGRYSFASGESISLTSSIFDTELGIFKGSHISNASDLLRAIERGHPFEVYDFTYSIDAPKQQIQHRLLSIQGTIPIEDIGLLEATYGWQRNDRAEFDAHNLRIPKDSIQALQQLLSKPAMRLLLETYSGDIKLKGLSLNDHINLTIGLATQFQQNKRMGKVVLIPDYFMSSIGAYTIANAVYDDVIISGGLRYDTRHIAIEGFSSSTRFINDSLLSFSGISMGGGFMWQLKDECRISLNLGQTWRPPQVNELYSYDIHHGTAQFEIGKRDLSPEQSQTLDLSFLYDTDNASFDISFFLNSFEGYILLQPDKDRPTVTVRGSFPTFRYDQVNANMFGFEIQGDYTFDNWLTYSLQGSMIRGDNLITGNPLFLMPSDRISSALHAHREEIYNTMGDAYIELRFTHVREQDRYDPNLDYASPPPGYSLLDLNIGGTILHGPLSGSSLNFSFQNIANTSYRDYLSRYRYFAQDTGFNFIVRLSMPIF
ncbi:MAG: TonB-dependent receptor [Bacteroidetes bacterium]|nr:TonB-dependent receptor [Bacteroidota bacterium]